VILLTPELRDRLLANGRLRDVDHVPVVKFFNPVGAATWLATELDEDNDTLFGLADLCFTGIRQIQPSRDGVSAPPFGLGIERDLTFGGAFPLSGYAEAARRAGSISGAKQLLSKRFRSESGRT